MKFGTTFAHPYVRDYFRLSVLSAFSELLSMNFEYLRLGCYWNEIERRPGEYDFGEVERLVEMAEREGQTLVLTIGMKAPRHPEFYVPGWTTVHQTEKHPDSLFRYLEAIVEHFAAYRCIHYWQIENEPLDPSGPKKLVVSPQFLEQEVQYIKRLTNKPVVLTLWGNRNLRDKRLNYLFNLGDRVGIDLYYHIPNGHGGTWGPDNSDEEIRSLLKPLGNKAWVMELQTNPWKETANMTHAEILNSNLNHVEHLGVKTVFLWGAEYWLALKERGEMEVWDQIRKRVPTK